MEEAAKHDQCKLDNWTVDRARASRLLEKTPKDGKEVRVNPGQRVRRESESAADVAHQMCGWPVRDQK